MRSSRSVVEKRRTKIMQMLETDGIVNVNELSKLLGASPLTIRRDLDALENSCLLERFYGGAQPIHLKNGKENNIFSSGLTLHKHAIAKRAASFVEDGDIIFINTSSTALAILPYITAKQVTVITNNVRAITCERRKDMMLVFTGGELHQPKEAMVGDFATNNLNQVTASKCFLGCNGLTVEEGLTTAVLQESSINSLMLTRVTGPRYIVADKTKIGRRLNFIYGPISKITCLITDTEAPISEVEKFRQYVEVWQVPPLQHSDN